MLLAMLVLASGAASRTGGGVAQRLTNGEFARQSSGWSTVGSTIRIRRDRSGNRWAELHANGSGRFGVVSLPRPITTTAAGTIVTAGGRARGDAGLRVCLVVQEWRGPASVGSASSCLAVGPAWRHFALVHYRELAAGNQISVSVVATATRRGAAFGADDLSLVESVPQSPPASAPTPPATTPTTPAEPTATASAPPTAPTPAAVNPAPPAAPAAPPAPTQAPAPTTSPSPTNPCTRYAGPNGSDSGPGSASAPFATVAKLSSALAPGQTGCLLTGVFNEDAKLAGGGASGNPITIRSAPGASATIVGRFYVPDAVNDVVISDLHLDGKNAAGLPSPTVNGDRITFARDDVTNEHTGICFNIGSATWGTAYDVTIEDSQVHDCGRVPSTNLDHGIYISDAVRTTIVRNAIWNNTDRGIQLYPNAQQSYIAHNVIDGNGEGIIFSGTTSTVSSANVVELNVISDSRIRNNIESWYPAGAPTPSGNIARNNCVWNGAQGNISTANGGFVSTGNIVADPLFVNPSAGDFHLRAGSGCAGTGL